MERSWLLVLAREAAFPSDGDLDALPPVPAETVAKALESCPLLSRQGLRFESASVESFSLDPRGVRYLLFDVEDALPIAKIAVALATGIGPLTLLDQDHRTVAEVKRGDAAEQLAAAMIRHAPDPPEESEPPIQGRIASSAPLPLAPERPPRRSLPPLRTALMAGSLLCLVGIPAALHRGVRGMLGCDPPPVRDTTDPPLAETESAIVLAHLMVSGKKDFAPSREGWIVVPASMTYAAHLMMVQPDGRRVIVDGWKRPIRLVRLRGTCTYRSYGPDGKDDGGRGDDISRTLSVD